jgi:hypothetical protein
LKYYFSSLGLFQLSAYSQNLVHLDVSWCQGVTQVGATKILSGCPKLKHLGIFLGNYHSF